MPKRKELKHEGLRPERNEHNLRERIFSELWADENKRRPGINFGATLLECILDDAPQGLYNPFNPPLLPKLTQRDAEVAATVIQWLGTNGGECFLGRARRKIQAELERIKMDYGGKK